MNGSNSGLAPSTGASAVPLPPPGHPALSDAPLAGTVDSTQTPLKLASEAPAAAPVPTAPYDPFAPAQSSSAVKANGMAAGAPAAAQQDRAVNGAFATAEQLQLAKVAGDLLDSPPPPPPDESDSAATAATLAAAEAGNVNALLK